MTRINCVPTHELDRQELLGEYHELPRVFTLARAAYDRGEPADSKKNPPQYTMGKGHVRFFYTRLEFLFHRWAQLHGEMRLRGYSPQMPQTEVYRDLRRGVPNEDWWREWTPSPEDMEVNRRRLRERRAQRGK